MFSLPPSLSSRRAASQRAEMLPQSEQPVPTMRETSPAQNSPAAKNALLEDSKQQRAASASPSPTAVSPAHPQYHPVRSPSVSDPHQYLPEHTDPSHGGGGKQKQHMRLNYDHQQQSPAGPENPTSLLVETSIPRHHLKQKERSERRAEKMAARLQSLEFADATQKLSSVSPAGNAGSLRTRNNNAPSSNETSAAVLLTSGGEGYRRLVPQDRRTRDNEREGTSPSPQPRGVDEDGSSTPVPSPATQPPPQPTPRRDGEKNKSVVRSATKSGSRRECSAQQTSTSEQQNSNRQQLQLALLSALLRFEKQTQYIGSEASAVAQVTDYAWCCRFGKHDPANGIFAPVGMLTVRNIKSSFGARHHHHLGGVGGRSTSKPAKHTGFRRLVFLQEGQEGDVVSKPLFACSLLTLSEIEVTNDADSNLFIESKHRNDYTKPSPVLVVTFVSVKEPLPFSQTTEGAAIRSESIPIEAEARSLQPHPQQAGSRRKEGGRSASSVAHSSVGAEAPHSFAPSVGGGPHGEDDVDAYFNLAGPVAVHDAVEVGDLRIGELAAAGQSGNTLYTVSESTAPTASFRQGGEEGGVSSRNVSETYWMRSMSAITQPTAGASTPRQSLTPTTSRTISPLQNQAPAPPTATSAVQRPPPPLKSDELPHHEYHRKATKKHRSVSPWSSAYGPSRRSTSYHNAAKQHHQTNENGECSFIVQESDGSILRKAEFSCFENVQEVQNTLALLMIDEKTAFLKEQEDAEEAARLQQEEEALLASYEALETQTQQQEHHQNHHHHNVQHHCSPQQKKAETVKADGSCDDEEIQLLSLSDEEEGGGGASLTPRSYLPQPTAHLPPSPPSFSAAHRKPATVSATSAAEAAGSRHSLATSRAPNVAVDGTRHSDPYRILPEDPTEIVRFKANSSWGWVAAPLHPISEHGRRNNTATAMTQVVESGGSSAAFQQEVGVAPVKSEPLQHSIAAHHLEILNDARIEKILWCAEEEGPESNAHVPFVAKEEAAVQLLCKTSAGESKSNQNGEMTSTGAEITEFAHFVNPAWRTLDYAVSQRCELFLQIPVELFPCQEIGPTAEKLTLYIESSAFSVDAALLDSKGEAVVAEATNDEGDEELVSWREARHPAASPEYLPPPPAKKATTATSIPSSSSSSNNGFTLNTVRIVLPGKWFDSCTMESGVTIQLQCHTGAWSSFLLRKIVAVKVPLCAYSRSKSKSRKSPSVSRRSVSLQ